jgi:hypothetical protein
VTITADTIILAAAILGAIAALWKPVRKVIRWIDAQEEQTSAIAELKAAHEKDILLIKEAHKKEIEALKIAQNKEASAIEEELCIISYGMLAALNGLRQLHCNGEVSKAYDKLEKHLNQRAHGQNKESI